MNFPVAAAHARYAPSAILVTLTLLGGSAGAQQRLPVFDVHLHALAATSQGPPPMWMCTPIQDMPTSLTGSSYPAAMAEPPCEDPIWSPMTDEEVMSGSIEAMERRNVYGVLSGSPARVAEWSAAAPGRFLPGLGFNVAGAISPDSLRRLHETGAVSVLAEVTNQYAGIEPNDPVMEPYWALAEELDMPVGIHMGPGPPGVAYLNAPRYRGRLHSALLLEEVLVRHRDLRVYVMHAGYPMIDDLLTLLFAHPQVHVGIGVIVYAMPRQAFLGYLRRIVEAGFAKRVMFGSDQMVWPETIERGIAVIEEATFLTAEQKRDILYNNAARFFRLTPEQIAAHHGR